MITPKYVVEQTNIYYCVENMHNHVQFFQGIFDSMEDESPRHIYNLLLFVYHPEVWTRERQLGKRIRIVSNIDLLS